MKRSIRKKGAALAMTLIVFGVAAILGASILELSLFETKNSVRDKKRMQAYYLAKSGVEATAAWMLNPNNNGESIIGKKSSAVNLGKGSYIVEVTRKSDSLINIKSTATVGGVKNSAAMSIIDAGSSSIPLFNHAILGISLVSYGGDTNIYNGGIIATGDGTLDPHGDKARLIPTQSGVNTDFPPFIFPQQPTGLDENLKFNNNKGSITVTGDLKVYNSITLENGKLIFDTGSDPNSVMKVVVNELNLLNGSVIIQGSGKVFLYVKKINDVGIKSNVNAGKSPSKLFVFLDKGCLFSFAGNRVFSGYVYGPDEGTKVDLAGCGSFTGAVIADTVYNLGAVDFYYSNEGAALPSETLKTQRFLKGQWLKQ